ncbi:hypothetical protein AAZX31_07G246300 [Glycine max]|uniref:DUF506 family protein n=2 Tax=Glycine subgen. Soja TaxID=1462606 RepID=I1KNI6_SOYBN|nr:uncharacterized protein LOC100800496 [Glycine max]XP_028241901.1 uncharacterized protein LOC114420213 [Glycine soja]KAG5024044.1 hypothetical protein JHK85_020386 [Glycine max]KAG5039114.1 hypothetical protein JHK86_019954 [Glycine max]KAG5144242.1 hypothetical protein JHK82_019937 [Glycine max]KAH1088765.1 hypothetical protein GYH30_019673 [Glycine max]KAH1243848.1 hypothetical protein GmHk_07G020840 [Glycine max]|eukprot:XP_003528702.1 uncharacterized protein LOC100800496 [Glycine max]
MGRTPVRFERVAAAFDADVARVRLCNSSENEQHSPEDSADLSDLVKSFMERGGEGEDAVGVRSDDGVENFDSEKREILEGIFDDDDGDAKEKIRREVQLAWGLVAEKDNSSPQFKQQLMSLLRYRGFDAGLCKCKWEKNTRFPAGDYEYIDVNFAGNRYIVEISLVTEFEIARSTDQYAALLDVFPLIFVGKMEELKQVVRLMCTAIKGSMKSMNMYIPPWRRIGYMQAKWFSSYKRITDEVATNRASSAFFTTRSIGFDARPVKSYNCRDDYGTKPAFRVCHLTTAFYVDSPGMQL